MSLPIKITLPDGFLKEEYRDGYLVSEKLKKIWAIDLDLFAEFSRVCRKHDIKFSVSFGTMIGAVRHKGFIPWDDDFDIMLERREYEKLMAIDPSEFQAPYFLQTVLSDRAVFSPLARFRNSATTGYISGYPKQGYNNGIYLDLYCFDANPQSRMKYLWKHFLKRVVGKLLGIYNQVSPQDGTCKQRLLYCLRPVARAFTYEYLWKLYCAALKLYNDTESHYSHMMTAQIGGRRDWIPKEAFSDIIMVPYEFCEVPIIRDYDRFLRLSYGDYMMPPPPEERGKWHEGVIHFEPEIPYSKYLGKKQ